MTLRSSCLEVNRHHKDHHGYEEEENSQLHRHSLICEQCRNCKSYSDLGQAVEEDLDEEDGELGSSHKSYICEGTSHENCY